MPRETSLNHLPLGRTHVFMRHHVLILFFGYMWLITKALLVYTHWLQFFFYFFDFFNYSWHNIRLVVVNHQNSYTRKSQRDYFWYLCFTVKKKFSLITIIPTNDRSSILLLLNWMICIVLYPPRLLNQKWNIIIIDLLTTEIYCECKL